MKSISGKHLCRVLEKKGWQLKNIHGSHHVYETSAKATALLRVILSEAKNLRFFGRFTPSE